MAERIPFWPFNCLMDDGGIHRMSDATEFRSVTYRLHPGTRARHVNLAQVAGACRYVWNHFLACNRRDYATYKLRKPMFDAGLVTVPALVEFSDGRAVNRTAADA